MIKHLSLRNFRKHEDLTLNFTEGLNVLRGANEAGKSTVIEAVLYALYGAKALRNSLAETVTWNHKDTELKVELLIQIDGVNYTFTRSKGGCECNYPGGKVVGQAEVTSFSAQLLGADAKTASLLMLANQSGLRGALDDGPTAVSGLMSKLADFDLIDRLLEAAQAKLLLGSDAPIKARLEQAQGDLATAIHNAPSEDSWKSLEGRVSLADETIARLKAQLEDANPKFSAAERAYMDAVANNDKISDGLHLLSQLNEKLSALQDQHNRAVILAKRVPAEEIQKAQDEVQQAQAYDAMAKAYALVYSVKKYPETFWEGTQEDFLAELEKARKEEQECDQRANAAMLEARSIRRQLIKGGKCPTCGHDAGNDEHVKQRNAEIETQAQAQDLIAATATREKASITAHLSALRRVEQAAAPFMKVRLQVEGRGWPVTIDDSVFPPRITWTQSLGPNPDLVVLKSKLKDLQDKDNLAIQNQGRANLLADQVQALMKQITETQDHLETLKKIDTDPLVAEYNKWAEITVGASQGIENQKAERDRLVEEMKLAKGLYEHSQVTITGLKLRIAEYEDDLKQLVFNNNLVKKLKTLKPSITDHLWNSVLAAVSNFFSSLRGEKSVVSKDASGFRVNGQSVDSLSGSTLDVLALATRVALTKTFIPHCSFLVLDEPAHGCDNARTSNVLGFLSSVGFAQTLLASHDELSESVADNVLTLDPM